MKKILLFLALLLLPSLAHAQAGRNPCYYNVAPALNTDGCTPVSKTNPLPIVDALPGGGITGNASGTTGAVVGTLAGVSGKTTYICGFNVSAIGGTAAVGPITIAGLITSSMVYQLTSSLTGVSVGQTFTPCIPASAANTAITITTTADGTASAVNVNSWGYQR
jgi:hypothetical protein